MILDKAISKNAKVAKKTRHIQIVSATTQTDLVADLFKPGSNFVIEGAESYASAITANLAINQWIVPARGGIFVTGAGITVHSTPEELALAALKAIVNSKVVVKGAATAITFTAAHVITASKWGIILIQMDNAGTISSKVPLATQAYATSGEALAALPSPDSTKIQIAYLLILNNAGDWTANTDDLTAASDITSITIVNTAAIGKSVTAHVPVAFTLTDVTLSTTRADIRGLSTDLVVTAYTTDGSGAGTNLRFTTKWRPHGLNGDGKAE